LFNKKISIARNPKSTLLYQTAFYKHNDTSSKSKYRIEPSSNYLAKLISIFNLSKPKGKNSNTLANIYQPIRPKLFFQTLCAKASKFFEPQKGRTSNGHPIWLVQKVILLVEGQACPSVLDALVQFFCACCDFIPIIFTIFLLRIVFFQHYAIFYSPAAWLSLEPVSLSGFHFVLSLLDVIIQPCAMWIMVFQILRQKQFKDFFYLLPAAFVRFFNVVDVGNTACWWQLNNNISIAKYKKVVDYL